MKTQTTRRELTPEFKAKVVIEALREQSTLADIANMKLARAAYQCMFEQSERFRMDLKETDTDK